MPDIFHTFPIQVTAQKVFEGISTPKGLDTWWTENSEGDAIKGNVYKLDFGPEYKWEAIVTVCEENRHFELQMIKADADWMNTKIGFILEEKGDQTLLEFYHTGWPEANEHYKTSSYCWAMYLRILKRNLESGDFIPYAERLSV